MEDVSVLAVFEKRTPQVWAIGAFQRYKKHNMSNGTRL